MQKQLQTQGATTLSDAERAKRAKTIDDKQKQLKRTGEDAQSDFQQEMQETFTGVASKVADLISSYSQQARIYGGARWRQSADPGGALRESAADITKAVIDAYNVKSGVPAPPAQPQAPLLPRHLQDHTAH